jgi:PAS domain-containing protein
VVDVNPFLTNLLGYSHAELVGRDLWEIGPDVMTIADEVDAQLTQTMDSYMNVMRKAGAA